MLDKIQTKFFSETSQEYADSKNRQTEDVDL